jgi:hypothetical protein
MEDFDKLRLAIQTLHAADMKSHEYKIADDGFSLLGLDFTNEWVIGRPVSYCFDVVLDISQWFRNTLFRTIDIRTSIQASNCRRSKAIDTRRAVAS